MYHKKKIKLRNKSYATLKQGLENRVRDAFADRFAKKCILIVIVEHLLARTSDCAPILVHSP